MTGAGGLNGEILSTLDWQGQPLILRRAQLSDVPEIVRFSRDVSGLAPQRPDLDEAVAWFTVGGPWMHPYTCERHLKSYAALGCEVWLVFAADESLVGQVEVWYDDEPEPFGRYGHIELLELRPDYLTDAVESWLIEQAEASARARGYRRFWCRPVGSGGSVHLLQQRGYERLWTNAQVTLRQLDNLQPPPYTLLPLAGDYVAEAAHLVALNHREAAGFRWRYLWRLLLDPENADLPRDTRVWAAEVRFADGDGGLCVLSLWPWYVSPAEARVDLWVRSEQSANAGLAARLLAVAGFRARAMGAESLISYVPKPLADALDGDDIEAAALEGDDPWYRKLL